MKKNRLIALVLVLCMVGTLLVGCSQNTTPTAAATVAATTASEAAGTTAAGSEPAFVGFSIGFSKVQHWQLETLGAQKAAEEMGLKFTHIYANGNATQQIADVENMKEMGIDMLLIGPADSEGIVPTIKSLQNAGVKVATSDIGVTGAEVASHVASDNYAIGVSAAEYVGELLKGKGRIAVVGWAAASATADREKGFVDTIKAKFPDIEIIVSQDVQSDRQVSLAACESIIQANSDINLIFGANAECALGAYAATQSTNRNDIYVISVDTDNEVMDAIAAGTNLVATVAQDPYTMGYQAMMNCAKYLKGEAVEDIAIPHEIVTKDNVAKIVARDQAYLAEAE